MKKIHLVMPMGGRGSRFFDNGFIIPKPLIEINGKPFLFWATQALRKFVEIETLSFIVLQEHIEKFSIDKKILAYFPEAKIIIIPDVLNGAVLTCLEGIKTIQNDAPIVFNDCDHTFCCHEFYEFCKREKFNNIDGALLTFKSNDPKFSFLQCDDNGNVTRTVEKIAISDDAICGAYYFKNKDIFQKSAEEYLEKCSYKEYFVSGLYNIMIENNMIVKQFRLDYHLPFGTPDEYKEAAETGNFEVFE